MSQHRIALVTRALWAVVAVLLLASATGLSAHDDRAGAARRVAARGHTPLDGEEAALSLSALRTTTTTAPPAPPPTTAPPAPAVVKPAPKPTPKPGAKAGAASLRYERLAPPAVPVGLKPYVGLGTWSDVFDWSNTYTNNHPGTSAADVDQMAGRGVQTLYIQASHDDSTTDVTDPDLLLPILRRAKEDGLRTVAWYLPTLTDPQRDMDRMLAIAKLQDVDSVAVDIEARNVSDVNERNARLVQFSQALRQALPGRTIGAIVLPPVVLEVVNKNYWPNFPYHAIAPFYDVWMTMGYWTNRTQSSGYRDAYRYTAENVSRLRVDVGQADLPVHPVGGLGDGTTPADIDAYRRAAIDVHAIGGGIYDGRTTAANCWAGLQGFRVG
jgi:hypothetical protein